MTDTPTPDRDLVPLLVPRHIAEHVAELTGPGTVGPALAAEARRALLDLHNAETAGMTPREAGAWIAVGRAAGTCLRLTDDEHHHPMEREEICHAFHVIQGWLSGRPFVRALQGDNSPTTDGKED